MKNFSGMIRAELTSSCVEAMLSELNKKSIQVYQICYIDTLTVACTVCYSDYEKMRKMLADRGESVKILERNGSYWPLRTFINRPVLILGISLVAVMSAFLSSFILFVEVKGNEKIPDVLILELAKECGIGFGVSRRGIRSEIFKNKLLNELENLEWAGVNTRGCTAEISVRERNVNETRWPGGSFNPIVASRAGVISNITLLRGELLCGVGQMVSAGDVLVSPYMDCGSTVLATGADAEIFADTEYEISVIMPDNVEKRGELKSVTTAYSIFIGKNFIKLSQDSGISSRTCDKMYDRIILSLPGGYQLPVGIVVERTEYYTSVQTVEASFADDALIIQGAEDYLRSQMISGYVTERDYSVEKADGCSKLIGKFRCSEMIGRIQFEEKVEYNE